VRWLAQIAGMATLGTVALEQWTDATLRSQLGIDALLCPERAPRHA